MKHETEAGLIRARIEQEIRAGLENEVTKRLHAELLRVRAEEKSFRATPRKKTSRSLTSSRGVSTLHLECTCSVCQELYVKPYTLSCSHSFCEECLRQWLLRKMVRAAPLRWQLSKQSLRRQLSKQS